MPRYTITGRFDKDVGVDQWHGHNAFIRDGSRSREMGTIVRAQRSYFPVIRSSNMIRSLPELSIKKWR